MSSFASKVTDTIPLPFDPGHSITVQKLTGRKLGKAQQAFMAELLESVRQGGVMAAQKELQAFSKSDAPITEDEKRAAVEAQAKAIAEAQADPMNGFDPYTLIRLGVIRYDDAPLTDAQIDDLTDEAVTFYATEVMRITKPSLFHTKEEAKAEQVKE